MARTGERALAILAACALLAIGTGWCLYYGRLGFQPLDSPIVFDGAWRVLSGQVPFRDFTTPAGLPSIYLQALFFRCFGVSWFAYCLHAALVNGLFCVLVCGLLRALGAGRGAALLYGALSAIVFYTPVGVPYLEQHGFFFLVLAAWLVACGLRGRTRRARAIAGALVPAALVLVFLSKPNVALLGLLPLGATFVFVMTRADTERGSWRSVAVGALAGTLAVVVLLVLLGWGSGVQLAKVRTHLLELPGDVGRERLGELPARTFVDALFARYVAAISPLFVTVAATATLVWMALRARRRDAVEPTPAAWPVLLAASWTLASALFVVSTRNNPQNGFPFVFLSLGIVHAGLDGAVPWPDAAPLRRWLGLFVAALALRDAYYFNETVNATRVVSDIAYDPAVAAHLRTPALSFLRFQVYPQCPLTPETIDGVVDWFGAHEGNFYYVGECTIVYALTGRPSLSPYLWYHAGLTVPVESSPRFAELEDEILRNLETYHVRYVVVGEGYPPDTFPRLFQYVSTHAVREEHVGCLRIVELRG